MDAVAAAGLLTPLRTEVLGQTVEAARRVDQSDPGQNAFVAASMDLRYGGLKALAMWAALEALDEALGTAVAAEEGTEAVPRRLSGTTTPPRGRADGLAPHDDATTPPRMQNQKVRRLDVSPVPLRALAGSAPTRWSAGSLRGG